MQNVRRIYEDGNKLPDETSKSKNLQLADNPSNVERALSMNGEARSE
jgi:hypothetical protein